MCTHKKIEIITIKENKNDNNMNFICYLCLIKLVYSFGTLSILVLYSEQTNLSLVEVIKKSLSSTINRNETFFDVGFFDVRKMNLADILEIEQSDITIDATFDLYWNNIIFQYTENNKIVNILLSSSGYDGEWQFFIHNSFDQHQQVAESLINFFGWKNLGVISNDFPINVKISSYIEEHFKNQISLKVILPDSLNEERIKTLIAKIIKPNGIHMFFILEEGEYFKNFIESLKNNKIYKKGLGILAGSSSIWASGESGIILYVEKGLEVAQSYFEYEILAIKQFTDIILEFKSNFINRNLNSVLLKQLFESKTLNHRKLPIFSIVNIADNQRMVKGEVNNLDITIFNSTFIYPGNSVALPKVSETEIVLSVASGSTEPNNLPNNIYNAQNFLGSLYAQWVVNNSTSLLKNFYISQFQTDCGSETFDFNFYYSCMSAYKDQLGVAFLSPSFESGAIGYVLVLRSLGLEIPHCGANTRRAALSNKTEYPEFMRVTSNDEYFAVIMAKAITYFGWNNVAIIYSNKTSLISVYNKFVKQCALLGISILNDEEKRMISPTYSRTDFKQFRYIFQNIYQSQARICIILMGNPFSLYFIEGLYDIGFRKGDIIPIFNSKTGGPQAAFDDLAHYIHKRKELMLGSLSLSSNEYFGDYGKQIRAEIVQAFYPEDPSYKCFSFDAFMLAAYGLDYTINQGGDIENPSVLNKNLRKQRFVGCSGVISIDSNNNDRSSAPIDLLNFYYNKTEKTYIETTVIVFNLVSSMPVNVIHQIIWPDTSHITPKDIRNDNFDCPFEKRLATRSDIGIWIFIGLCFFIFAISVIFSLLIWNKWKSADFPKLTKAKKMKFADIMVYSIITIDFFQYLYLGPLISSMNPGIAFLSEIASADFSSLISLKRSNFWIAMILTLLAVYLSIIMNVLTTTKIKYYIQKGNLVYLKISIEAFMPLIGNALFIPINLFLIDIFSCTHATGNDISETYLDKDCYQYCWREKHLVAALLSIIAFFIYFPLTVYSRPLYQESQESLHIKASPKYLIIKSEAQILFVVLKKTLGYFQDKIYGFIYLILFIIYTLAVYHIKPYNYDKTCFALLISMIMILWSIIWTSISNLLDLTNIPWLCCQMIGWTAILIWGTMRSNKIPSLIIIDKGLDISILFKFMLGLIEADKIHKKPLKLASKKSTMRTYRIDNLNMTVDKSEFQIESYSSNSINIRLEV